MGQKGTWTCRPGRIQCHPISLMLSHKWREHGVDFGCGLKWFIFFGISGMHHQLICGLYVNLPLLCTGLRRSKCKRIWPLNMAATRQSHKAWTDTWPSQIGFEKSMNQCWKQFISSLMERMRWTESRRNGPIGRLSDMHLSNRSTNKTYRRWQL